MEKTKAKVQQSVEDIADELIALYKEREMSVGYQYGEDTAEQHDFEMDFPYELTPTKLNLLKKLKKIWKKNVQWIACYVEMWVTEKLKLLYARPLKLSWKANKLPFSAYNDSSATTLRNID